MEPRLVYVTFPDLAAAQTVGRDLVTSRLAACVNILGGMRAIYHWDGKLVEDEGIVLLAKTTAAQAEALVARVRQLHADECPCILVLPIVGGNPGFLAWIAAETA